MCLKIGFTVDTAVSFDTACCDYSAGFTFNESPPGVCSPRTYPS